MADRIMVFDGGVITEEGTHDALLARDGAYARMFRLEADGDRDAVPTAHPEAAEAPL